MFHIGVPMGQGRFGIRKSLGEFIERFRVMTCIKVILKIPAPFEVTQLRICISRG